MTDRDILNYALENDIIDVREIKNAVAMNERKKFLNSHKYQIWQGSNDKYYTYITEHNKRKLIKRNTLKALEDAIIETYRRIDEEPYIEDVFKEWIADKLVYGEISKQTAERYEMDFDRFFSNSELLDVKFNYITSDMLEDYIRSTIYSMQLTSKAWSGLRTIINGMFKFAKKKGYTKLSITEFMGDMDLSKRVFKKVKKCSDDNVFTDEEVKAIINCIGDSDNVIDYGILLAFQTGMRAGELSALKWVDYINENTIYNNRTEIRYKNNEGFYVYEVRDSAKTEAGTRNVYLTTEGVRIMNKLKELCPNTEYVFTKYGERVKGKAFTSRLYRICNKLNINKRSLHQVRKTYATKLLDANIPESVIIEQLGHTQISTTKSYYYYNPNKSDKCLEYINGAVCY